MIPPKFEKSAAFFNGLAGVQIEKRFGYIDKQGQTAVRPYFAGGTVFSDGYAAVETPSCCGGKWIYLDRRGLMIPDLFFIRAKPFSEGLAAVRNKGWGYINTQGKYVIKPQFEVANNFSHGLASAAYRAGHNQAGKFGFIDRTGSWVIKQAFERAGTFSEGLARIRINELWGYINPVGRIVIAPPI